MNAKLGVISEFCCTFDMTIIFSFPSKTGPSKAVWRIFHFPLQSIVRILDQSLEMLLVTNIQVHPQSFYDLVNIIREHEEIFIAWHSSDIAKLYSPAVFRNKKQAGGYWF